MRHRIIFGITALCAAAMCSSDKIMTSVDNGLDDSAGAGSPLPKGDNIDLMDKDDMTLGGTGDKVKVDGPFHDEGARDMTTDDMILGGGKVDGTGDAPVRDQVPIGTFMVGGTGDTPDVAGSRLAA